MKKVIFPIFLSILTFLPVNAQIITVDTETIVPIEIQTNITSNLIAKIYLNIPFL